MNIKQGISQLKSLTYKHIYSLASEPASDLSSSYAKINYLGAASKGCSMTANGRYIHPHLFPTTVQDQFVSIVDKLLLDYRNI